MLEVNAAVTERPLEVGSVTVMYKCTFQVAVFHYSGVSAVGRGDQWESETLTSHFLIVLIAILSF